MDYQTRYINKPDLFVADCRLSDNDLWPPDLAEFGGFSLDGGDGCFSVPWLVGGANPPWSPGEGASSS